MHLRSLLLSACLSIVCFTKAQTSLRPAIVWQKWYGGSGDDKATDVLLTSDGGMIVAGVAASNDGDVSGHHGGNDGWVIKLDALGQKQWQRSVGGSGDEAFNTIKKCAGGYICVGYSNSNDGDISGLHNTPGGFNRDCWVVKLSDSGSVLWSKVFGGSKDDQARSCVETFDGNFIIIGSTYSTDGDVQREQEPGQDAWIFKLNAAGELTWENTIRTTQFNQQYHMDQGFGIAETPGHQVLAYVSGYKVADTSFYQLVGMDDTVPIYDTATYNITTLPGVLFNVNPGNGEYTYVLQTEGYGNMNMKVLPDGIYFHYFNTRFVLNDPGNIHSGVCSQEESFVTKLDHASNNFTTIISSAVFCQYYAGIYHRFFPGFNGADGVENGQWMQVGTGISQRADCGGSGATVLTPGGGSYGYGGTSHDGFAAVKAFSNGYEFVCAGNTQSVDGDLLGHGPVEQECLGVMSDFWIVKLSLSTNLVSGHVFLDENNNNLKDPGEPAFTKGMLQVTGPGQNVSYGINEGHYAIKVDTGSFITRLVVNNPSYYSAEPALDTFVFNNRFNTDTVDFAVHKNGDFIDNSVSFFAPGAPVRPGRVTGYSIRIANNGTIPLLNRPLTLIKDHRLSFSSASIAPVSMLADTIVWNIDSLPVDGYAYLYVNLLADIPPVLNGGDTVSLFVRLDSIGDNVVLDNEALLRQEVVNSFDPNDKQEVHGGTVTKLEVLRGNYLTYTIRFQNTGNDTAFNIIIKDVLDDKLATGTFEMLSASHPYQLKIKDGKYISWEFNDVMLVDSIRNEPESHGFITYRIKTNNNLVIGDSINNRASIYFDFNPPVITNTTVTAVTKTTAVWTGSVSAAWEDAANWNINAVPDAETEVIIPGGLVQYPVVNSNAVCYSVKADGTAIITISSTANLAVMGK